MTSQSGPLYSCAIGKVGLPSAGCSIESASSRARAKVVFPAPSSPSRKTRSPVLSWMASSEAKRRVSASEQPGAVFGRSGGFDFFDVLDGIADVLDNVGRGHAAVTLLGGREVAGQAVQVNAEKRPLESVHLLAEKSADHSGQDVAASGGRHSVIGIVVEVENVFGRGDQGR